MAGNEGFNPHGLRILVVDDNEVELFILKHMLVGCCYNVTTTNRAEEALAMLREHPDNFDLVLSDVMMPDMDGFKLLEMIGLTMDLPVIMMSANAETSVVMKGITHGACDYLIKPVRIEELKNIWQHVIRKRVREHLKDETVGDTDDTARTLGEQDQFPKKRKEKFTVLDEPTEDLNSLKKARVLWSKELHEQFVQAVNHIGIDKAVPTRILEVMNVQGLTRENIASHLQKYRMYLKRLSGIPLQPHPVASFKASGSGGFGGVMHIQPGGKISSVSSGTKGVNLGSGLNSNLGRGAGGSGPIDRSTLLTLSQLQERQRAVAPTTTATNVGQISGGTNVRSAASWQFHPLQRMSSAELDNLMFAAHEDCVAQQRLNCIPVIKDDLGSSPGLRTMRIGEEMSVLAGLGNVGSGEMETLADLRTSKMEHVEVADVGELGLDKFRDFGSPSPLSTVSTMSGGVGSESSFGTYTEFAAGRDFLASSPPEFGLPAEGGLVQSKGDRGRAGGGVPYGSHSLHGQEEFARPS